MRLVVFDLDGTLIDSRRDLADSTNALIVERGGQSLPVETIVAMVGEGAALLVERALTAAGVEPDVASALPRFLEIYDERLLANTVLYPGTREALDAIARQATLAVLTNKPQRPTERILEGLGLAGYFQHVIGGNTRFGRKPDPSGMAHLMEVSGVSPRETTLVGDSAVDLRTARAAGVRICLVTYGFGFPLAVPELSGEERLADTPSALVALVRSPA